jgi:hypothetical protein
VRYVRGIGQLRDRFIVVAAFNGNSERCWGRLVRRPNLEDSRETLWEVYVPCAEISAHDSLLGTLGLSFHEEVIDVGDPEMPFTHFCASHTGPH